MNGREHPQALERLYGARADARDILTGRLRTQLPDLGEALAAQLAELERDPTRDRAERVLANLAGVAAHVRRLIATQEARE